MRSAGLLAAPVVPVDPAGKGAGAAVLGLIRPAVPLAEDRSSAGGQGERRISTTSSAGGAGGLAASCARPVEDFRVADLFAPSPAGALAAWAVGQTILVRREEDVPGGISGVGGAVADAAPVSCRRWGTVTGRGSAGIARARGAYGA